MPQECNFKSALYASGEIEKKENIELNGKVIAQILIYVHGSSAVVYIIW